MFFLYCIFAIFTYKFDDYNKNSATLQCRIADRDRCVVGVNDSLQYEEGGMDQWMSTPLHPIQFKANYPYSPFMFCFTLIVPDHVMFDFVTAGAGRCRWAASTSCQFSSPGWWSTSTTASSTKRYADEFPTIVCS